MLVFLTGPKPNTIGRLLGTFDGRVLHGKSASFMATSTRPHRIEMAIAEVFTDPGTAELVLIAKTEDDALQLPNFRKLDASNSVPPAFTGPEP